MHALSRLLIPISILFFFLFTLSCEKKTDSESTTQKIRPVRTELVKLAANQHNRKFSGTAKAGVESRLSFRVSGVITDIPTQVGQTLKQGQLIASLNPTDYKIKVQKAEASLTQARADARNSAAQYERTSSLYETESVSKNDLDVARASHESAQAMVQSAVKQLRLEQQNLSYTKLTAPIDGCSVASVQKDIGEHSNAGESIVVVNCGNTINVDVAIPDSVISQLNVGDQAIVDFSALPNDRFTAIITEVGVQASANTTFPVSVQLKQSTTEIRAGMAADITFTLEHLNGKQSITVPMIAVQSIDNKKFFVFLFQATSNNEGTVEKRFVTIGQLNQEGRIHITTGLAPGDRVITAGIRHLTEGMTVKLYALHK